MIRNKINKNTYIGSSRKIEHRWAVHLHDMKSNGERIGNYKLRKDFHELGLESFEWIILEVVDEADALVEREQSWLDAVKPYYNIRKTAHNNKPTITETSILAAKRGGEKRRGIKQSEETKAKRSESLRRHWAIPENRAKLKKTDAQKEALRQLATGEKNGNYGKKRPKEFGDLISNLFSSIQYTFVSPEGQEVTFNNLLGNGEKMTGLRYWQLRQLYRGNKKEYNGWTFKSKQFVGYKKER